MKVRIDPLDRLASEVVRRQSGGYCARCGRYYGWQNLQACHFHSRRKKATRWDLDNIVALDFGCHQYFHENHKEFEDFMLKRLGEQAFDMLQARTRTPVKYVDKEAIRLYLKAKIQEIGNEDNIWG